MTWAVLVTNNKGGTGKSTVAEELAYGIRDEGFDVGVVDADIDSANLASRMGCEEKVTFKGDHIIEPVKHDGLKLYSMENAFQESTFSQSGVFMKEVINNMINHSDWGDLDYMVVDCPPGSSDVFDELVTALRPSILGAISVGQPDAVDDTLRLVKVCNHNWVPIIGFVENMSGMVCHGKVVTCSGGKGESEVEGGVEDLFDDDEEEGHTDAKEHPVDPFGSGNIEEFVNNLNGNFLGRIPLVVDEDSIRGYDNGTIDNAIESIEQAEPSQMPDDNIGNPSFIKNVWNILRDGINEMNELYDVESIQDKFGVEDREPLIMKMELSDAGPISSRVLDSVVITIDGGDLKPMKEKTAKKKGYSIEGGIKISSQDLYDSIRGEKEVMRAVSGEITTESYSITKAVQMGDAEVWGERTINRLAVLDKILSEVVDMEEVRKILN